MNKIEQWVRTIFNKPKIYTISPYTHKHFYLTNAEVDDSETLKDIMIARLEFHGFVKTKEVLVSRFDNNRYIVTQEK